MAGPNRSLTDDLHARVPAAALVPEVSTILNLESARAAAIVEAFDAFVARPLEQNFARLRGRDLAKRNPMIYTARGVNRVAEWVDRVLEDKETSAIEGHIATFLEEVARIISGGIKPGSGVDLQVENADGSVLLYAIQTAPNTKNAGSRASDIASLKRAAKPLRAARRHVELRMAVLSGRNASGSVGAEPEITTPSSDEFWEEISGTEDFRSRLLTASIVLSRLVAVRSSEHAARVRAEAEAMFGDAEGALDVAALAAIRRPLRNAAREE